jgi:hypothetical protein
MEEFAKNFRAALLDENLSNDTTSSQIYLDGQHR